MNPQPPLDDPRWGGRTTGAIYGCLPDANGRLGVAGATEIWLPTAAGAPVLTPEEAAREVNRTMHYEPITIGIVPEDKPGSIGAVGLPVYMWTTPSETTFGPQFKTATLGGRTASLNAKVARVIWDMGDGTRIVCRGPGTPYRDSYGLDPSPTCGHKYQKTSVGKPGHAYTVRATTVWRIDWTSSGQSGVFTNVEVAETQIRIGELQAIETA